MLRWLGLGLAGIALTASGSWLTLTPELPDISILKQIKYETPLQVLTRDGKIISEFGVKHTVPLKYAEIPTTFVNAFLAAEDDQFFQHSGIDYSGLARAFGELATTGSIRSGGSTITMQLAKNYFLTNERTFNRKFTEIMLARRIEASLTKKEILELYLNKIYLGHRAYGIGAAARIYYGKTVNELTLAQMAMIAGLPKAPSRYNPVTNAERSMIRRNWILGRMLKLGHINQSQYNTAINEKVNLNFKSALQDVNAPYLAEMVREELLKQFGESIYQSGYRVYTTVKAANQDAANQAVINGLLAYDQRHGWRGREGSTSKTPLKAYQRIGGLEPAEVINVAAKALQVKLRDDRVIDLPWDKIQWARRYIDTNRIGFEPKTASQIANVGDIVRVQSTAKGWRLAQIPRVQGQLIALDPEDGSVEALVGGFDYDLSKFNRSTQGWRQIGSTIKPFIYTKALETGFSPTSLIDDAPYQAGDWAPSNSDGEFMGPITLRRALYLSRNMVSIRLLESVGVSDARHYISRFGFDKERLPSNLTMALGTGEALPIQVATAYAAIANGGLRVNPYFIEKVVDRSGKVLFEAKPKRVCRVCELPEVIPTDADSATPSADQTATTTQANTADSTETAAAATPAVTAPVLPPPETIALRIVRPRAAYQMYNIMQDVILRGTGRAALSLGRTDLAGKTGTTNEARDAWFAGFNGKMVAVSWVGFDTPESLGKTEYGGVAALPIWRDYMATALRGMPASLPPVPVGLVSLRVNRLTGATTNPDDPDAINELIRQEKAASIEAAGDNNAPVTAPAPAPAQTDPVDELKQQREGGLFDFFRSDN